MLHRSQLSARADTAGKVVIVAGPSLPERFLHLTSQIGSHLQSLPLFGEYEYVESIELPSPSLPFASMSASQLSGRALPFARASQRNASSQAAKKVEYHSVKKVTGDGRCMFRALVLGMAANSGEPLSSYEEEEEADELRMAVADVLCRGEQRRVKYEEALIAITVEESMKRLSTTHFTQRNMRLDTDDTSASCVDACRYCQRITRSDFWGGESELLVLSRMCAQPIVVYVPEAVAKQGTTRGNGYVPIQEYGSEFGKKSKEQKGRKPVRLLFNGSNHYDLLL